MHTSLAGKGGKDKEVNLRAPDIGGGWWDCASCRGTVQGYQEGENGDIQTGYKKASSV